MAYILFVSHSWKMDGIRLTTDLYNKSTLGQSELATNCYTGTMYYTELLEFLAWKIEVKLTFPWYWQN